MRPRFHLPDIDAAGRGLLAGDEAGHLTRVLRLGVGAAIDVFDGRGGMFEARVVEVGRGGVTVQTVAPVASAPEPAVRVTLVMSVLKGDKMDEVVRDATMMGVADIQPVVARRSEVSLAALARGHRLERWQRIALSSVKQCGRAMLPAVHPAVELSAWIARKHHGVVLVLTEPAAGRGRRVSEIPRAADVALLVGPEGGWAPEEAAACAAAGFQPVALGGRTLRAEAAPVVGVAALYEGWGGW